MKISNRFTIAVHILSLISVRTDNMTSEQIADSVNINAGYIRQISGLLKKAGLIGVKRGSGGAYLLKEPGSISLYDVYQAVDVVIEGELFHWHENPNPNCWVGSNIHDVLEIYLLKAQQAMEEVLRAVSIHEITEIIIRKKNASSGA
ncbi:Rrf2 family transcriptional regulator [Brevibacillus formosus]|uniref:Rrf2 family transcriptional regulator n=1 Tax=Brevibacillus TaxID=55080 RepID=UPI000D0F42B6|nr:MULTISPECIES: Rrf2 family transcriptional regulator [Brevibacillus]MBG9940805.1 Rrf2 family transcriptional regulator [Brevibacillus formosus]MED1943334.1 Rrf2 family transcriptional regulator [Brevibacillus formosus]MED2000294.1 Rrf2 family transcriptional regulator [Brevibacillus formosus]MED2082947.1 Rrf2 family transcriptional regulator [Brevibacillus formosus]PSK17348.1 transcriptional regulator [Brevibacillus sp. NRRL NRS-603]